MKFVEFLSLYWREILEVLAIVVSIVICCIKKRPVQVVDTVKETICRLLPYCISQSEDQPKGKKLEFCMALLASTLEGLGIHFNDDYTKFALEQVEVILSTPQKKGVNVDAKKNI